MTTHPDPDPESFTYARELALACVPYARQSFAAIGHVLDATFILARHHPETREPFSPPKVLSINLSVLSGGFGRDIAQQAQRQACEKAGAIAVVRVFEAWLHVAHGILLDASAPVSREACRQVVFIGLEHAAGATAWALPVTEGSLGEPEEIGAPDLGESTGAMTGYFKSEDVNA